MNKTLVFCLWWIFFTGYLVGHGQSVSDGRHYVIIGAFSSEANAVRFAEQAVSGDFNAAYAFNAARGVYYVYVMATADRRAAYAYGAEVRRDTEYKDAWVFSGALDIPQLEAEEEPVITEPEPVVVQEEPEIIEEPEEVVVEENVQEEEQVEETLPVANPDLKPFYFKLVNSTTGEEVSGQVYLLENKNANQFRSYGGNTAVQLSSPANADQTWFVRVNAPGYYPIETEISYNNTIEQDEAGNTLVKLDLARSRTGHYIEFNNVRFLSNSAIFTPESEPELDAFVDLLRKNPKYRIRVHGHCNGRYNRNATIRSDSPEFFARSGGNREISASPRKLTGYRAELVRDYLVLKGIEGRRIKTKAEGASTMLFPANGPLGQFNDRVEIEITKGK